MPLKENITHYFYNSKTRCDRQTQISDSYSTSRQTLSLNIMSKTSFKRPYNDRFEFSP